MADSEKPIVSFGLVTDVQYADKDDGSYENRIQRYRESPHKLCVAVEEFNDNKEKLSFILTLGDIIDGNTSAEKTQEDFDVVLEKLEKLQVEPVHHALGNHCLSLPRKLMLEKLNMPERYYSVRISSGWKLIVLDSMDLSVKWPEGTSELRVGQDYLLAHPLSDLEPQMSTWNGGIGEVQKKWLEELLSEAERMGDKILVALHHPLVEGSAPSTHLLWNHEEIRDLLVESPAVVAVLCGHFHVGGYKQLGSTHFVTVEAILEAPTDEVAHAIVDVYEDHLRILGRGTLTSRVLEI